MNFRPTIRLLLGLLLLPAIASAEGSPESLWIEAEHLEGIRGYCWPMGKAEMKRTAGHWALSGPGWAAEWTQGGESGFLSIATGAEDDGAAASKTLEIPVDGEWFLWVRYGDWREQTEQFEIRLEQEGAQPWTGRFGQRAVIEEDNELKLYWNWAFAWDGRPLKLRKGPAKLILATTTKDSQPRQVDVIVLTTDPTYRPRVKERPSHPAWKILETWRSGLPKDLEPLARRGADHPVLHESWKLPTFNNGPFLYLWNVSHTDALTTWLGDKPDRVKFPYNIADADVREAFEKTWGGRDDVPIFSDPRIVPTFHGVGAGVFATQGPEGEVQELGQKFASWLQAHPGRPWATMMNYHGGLPIGPKGQELFAQYRNRYVGAISGESLGYFYPDEKAMRQATTGARTRRQLVEAFVPLTLESNRAKYRAVYGRDLDENPYRDVMACLSVGNIAFMPLCVDWGARTVGYESSAMTWSLLNMRWAFMRGAARQFHTLTCTYRSCNFGDASTIFSNAQSFTKPQNLMDNFYSVISGAGMTWYKMDIWYQYMAGASMFYHEQGFDEYWMPGGTTAAGVHPVQLSPKGKLVDRFLRVTAKHPDRGHPFTPIAFLVDHAHGWEPSPFWPNAFKNWHGHQDRFLYGDHEKMLEEYFAAAYHPIGHLAQQPITATNEVYVPGVFGDVFDVIFAYPDVAKWRTLDTYPVVIAAGDIELTEAEGRRLAQYVEAGGTLLVADAHITGPGLASLKLPESGPEQEAESFRWMEDPTLRSTPRFKYRPITGAGLRPMARTPQGDIFCAAADRGRGRLIWLSVPRGMTIGRQASPVLAHLLAGLRTGLMPVEVTGDVQWMLNRGQDRWIVTLLNPAGQAKPQHGITPTDFRENRRVRITSSMPIQSAADWLMPDEKLEVRDNTLELEVPAGGVRIIELMPTNADDLK